MLAADPFMEIELKAVRVACTWWMLISFAINIINSLCLMVGANRIFTLAIALMIRRYCSVISSPKKGIKGYLKGKILRLTD